VAADADGDFVVVWISGGVFGQRYTSTGTAVGSEFQVNTEANDEPAVAAATDGDFVVVWTSVEQDGNLRGVFGQRYTSTGTALGSEFQVNTYTTSFQYAPAVAVTADGHFVVAWTSYSQDGDAHGVFGQRYTSTGAGLGSEFQVNTYTTSSQYEDRGVAVAADADGDFVVVWTSTPDQDGDAHGVFGQRFDLLCGDGNLDPGEGCDDGNTTSGDGCSALCQVETCFSCTGAPSICTPITACTNADSCCPPSCTPGNDDDCAIIPAVTPFGWVLLTGLLVTVMTWRLRRREGRRGR
jgi:cysteine-rich repeat protein